jgi:hypothetical protein
MLRSTIVGIAVAFVAAACAAAALLPVVPIRAQRAIKKRTSVYSYVPTTMPRAFRYSTWTFSQTHKALVIFFHQEGKPLSVNISFSAYTRPGKICANRPMQKFRTSSGTVYWSRAGFDQDAWRCVTGPNRSLTQLTASSSTGIVTAKTLALVAASGRKIR